ncbi:MAG: hypothetical protein IT580_05610 [Verrucomicrobiales bacterium]|nr:hypothetical protein [Verrucomicrobiales bacterium]
MASTLLNLGDLQELQDRFRPLLNTAVIGGGLLILGVLLMGRTRFALAVHWLGQDCGPLFWRPTDDAGGVESGPGVEARRPAAAPPAEVSPKTAARELSSGTVNSGR